MPYMKIYDKTFYYKEYGHGEPIVFLNGILMETNSWSLFIRTVSKDYRMIVVDLLDQGKSDNGDEGYIIETQADYLNEILRGLRLTEIHLLGMSYGGRVALAFALKYGNVLKTLILSNTNCDNSDKHNEIMKTWMHAAKGYDAKKFVRNIMPYMYSTNYYERNFKYMKHRESIVANGLEKRWFERLIRLLDSGIKFDVSNQINNIQAPTLIIGSELDIVTPAKCQRFMHQQIADSKLIIFNGVAHAVLYEASEEYISVIIDFIKANPINNA